MDSLIKTDPVDLIVGSLEVPVHQAVSGRVPVADGVDIRDKSAVLTEINSKVRVGFVVSTAVSQSSAHKVFDLSSTD